jgi:hypothetical protein
MGVCVVGVLGCRFFRTAFWFCVFFLFFFYFCPWVLSFFLCGGFCLLLALYYGISFLSLSLKVLRFHSLEFLLVGVVVGLSSLFWVGGVSSPPVSMELGRNLRVFQGVLVLSGWF